MINMADCYDDSLNNIVYSKQYNIRIHAIQSALNLLGYIICNDVNKNAIRYGYYCVNTENMITHFQKDNSINIDGKLTEETWNSIFNTLFKEKQLIIVKSGDKEVTIVDIDKYMASQHNNERKHPNLDSHKTLKSNVKYNQSNSSKSFITDGNKKFDNDIYGKEYGKDKNYPNLNVPNNGFDYDDYNDNNDNDKKEKDWSKNYILDGNEINDNLMYNYIVSGGKEYNNMNYNYNLDGKEEWDDSNLSDVYSSQSEKDYDFIYNLLSNSIYQNNWYDGSPLKESKSSTASIGYYGGGFETSTNKPFFNPDNMDKLRKSKFDVTIVYGAKGENARKIRDVTPMSVSQQLDASGAPLYDIYEFVARDVSYGI